jgi:hypothetical protein
MSIFGKKSEEDNELAELKRQAKAERDEQKRQDKEERRQRKYIQKVERATLNNQDRYED